MMKMLRMSGLGVIVIYLIGWIIALIGLALGQDWCKDHLFLLDSLPGGLPVYTLLAHETGENCRTLYRFPWLIWALSALPVLLALGHLIKPTLVRRGSSALFAALLVFQVFAANTFHDLAEAPLADMFKVVERGNHARLSGFAIMAAMSLLMIILESFLGDETHDKHAHDAHGGRVPARDTAATKEPVAAV